METSKGAGIQPKKAIKKVISTVPEGKIWLTSKASFELNKATETAAIVLIVKIIMMYFIKLSNNLYLPINRNKMLTNIKILDHKTKLFVMPNN